MTNKPVNPVCVDASNYVSDRVFNGTRPLSSDHVTRLRANYAATQYPELRSQVRRLVPIIIQAINDAAQSTVSTMPYKSQWILEETIKELQRRV